MSASVKRGADVRGFARCEESRFSNPPKERALWEVTLKQRSQGEPGCPLKDRIVSLSLEVCLNNLCGVGREFMDRFSNLLR